MANKDSNGKKSAFPSIAALAEELLDAYRSDLGHPFPYADCRTLQREFKADTEGLIPDLDLYFYNIASACNGARKLQSRTHEQLREVQQRLTTSFFEAHPEYRVLEARINTENTPHLYQKMMQHEALRARLLTYLALLLTESSGADGA